MKKVERAEFPNCGMCFGYDAICDAPTLNGAWEYMCRACLEIFGGADAWVVGFEFVPVGSKRRSEDSLAKEIRDAVYAGDFSLAEDLIGDRDPAEFL